jgi:glycosyltransferase involved in cell wall biosynthesis
MPGQLDGGLANYIKKTGLGLAQKGHRVSVFVLSDRAKLWNDGPVEITEIKGKKLPRWLKGKQFHPFINQILGSRSIKNPLWRKHQQAPFDILQASSYMTPGLSMCKNGRIPLVCRISSYTPLCRAAQGKEHRFGDYLSDWLELHQITDADAAFAPSYFISKTLERLENYPISVMHSPLGMMNEVWDTAYYQSSLSGKKYLLYFGTLGRMKGVDLLAEIMPKLLKEHEDLVFVFIGRDNSKINGMSYFDYIRSRSIGLENRLHYHPALPKSQLYPVIANAFGVVIPSRVDNYPNVCLEALSLDIPVVGSDNSSLEELITDRETGFLAQNSNPESFYQAILHLLNQTPDERTKMRGNIHALIEKIKAEDRIDELLAFYEKIINKYQNTDKL